MLTVAKVTGKVAAGYADYLEGKTQASQLGDYYLRDGERVEAPGRWVGTSLGARPEVDGRELRELMAVRHPQTGKALRPVGAGGEAVAALDATFSAPKSVSAAWALADPELRAAIEQAHEHAIDQALRYAVSHVAMVRRRVDRKTVVHVKAADVVATSWRHTTARAVDGRPPDPQLHSHILLHAAVRTDGRLAAIDSRAWWLSGREVGAAYRTELAHRLARLGFEIKRGTGRGGRYFEITGIPQTLIDQWSSRHHQVQQTIQARLAAKQDGAALSTAEERLAAVTSRADKQPVTRADLDRAWRHDGQQAGLDPQAVRRLRDPSRPMPTEIDTHRLLGALTEFDATFNDREARAVALEQSAGVPAANALAVLDQARADGQLLSLADGRQTTTRHRHHERDVVATTAQLAQEPVAPIDRAAVLRAQASADSRLGYGGGGLSGEQRQALELAASHRRIVMIEGQAGTGKSTVLQAVAHAHQADGQQVIVTSTGALAAQRLARDLAEAGVEAPSYSTAALRHAVTTGHLQLNDTTTVIHDEAALASTREQQQLLQMVQESGARLVLVGDPQQSKPVGAGGLWSHIERELEQRGARVELTHNLRAHDPEDRRDQALFRQGEHLEALRGYADRGRVRVAADQADTEDGALRAAQLDRRAGRRPLVIAQTTNEHLDELNAQAQALRALDGELGTEALPLPGRPHRLHAGDEVQIRHSINHPDHGLLRNGTTATVTDINPTNQQARLQLGDGAELQLARQQLEQADLRLAYVQHPFPAQGATSDTTHLILAEHATREGSYVALTRARHTTHIHASFDQLATDPEHGLLERLATRLSATEPDLPSIATPLAHEQQLERHARIETPDAGLALDRRPWVQLREHAPEIDRDDVGYEL